MKSTTETNSLISDKTEQISVLKDIENNPISSNEDFNCTVPLIENIMNLTPDHFIDTLADDYESGMWRREKMGRYKRIFFQNFRIY